MFEEEDGGLEAVRNEIEETVSQLKAMLAEAKDEGTGAKAKVEELTAEIAHLRDELRTLQVRAGRPNMGEETQAKTIGQMVVESELFKQAARDGTYDTKTIKLKGSVRDLTGTIGSSSVVVDNLLRPGVVEQPRHRPSIRDLLTVVPVSGDTVRYIKETADYELYTELSSQAASGQAVLNVKRTAGFYAGLEIEVGSGTANAETKIISSVDKDAGTITLTTNLANTHAPNAPVTSDRFEFTPESELNPRTKWVEEEKNEPIKKIATSVPLPNETMNDAPRMAAILNRKLPRKLRQSEDYQLLHGNGSTNQLTGFLNAPGRIQYAWSSGLSTDTKADALARGGNLVYLADYMPNGVVLHPTDMLDIKLAKDDNGQYLYRMEIENQNGEKVIMDLVVVTTKAMPQGKALVGAFDMAASLNDREEIEVRIFDQHSDFAERGMVLARAEARMNVTIEREKAFCEVDLSTAP
ncbi:MAG: phage major capsid protein [Myxococcota bacterium]